MDEAMNKLRNGAVGLKEAHRVNKIPKPTLRHYLVGRKIGLKELVLESSFFVLSITDTRK